VEAVVSEPPNPNWDAWEPEEPPAGFVDRVMDRVAPPKVRPLRRWPFVAGAVAMAAAAAVILVPRAPSEGETIAQDRVEVAIGRRALAVLEPGASVKWKGNDVVQARGDAFYRVEPGTRFVVHTPAGDVEVKGTCFTVRVRTLEEGKEDMQRSQWKAAAAGAAVTALAFVVVHEGKVAVSHAGERVELTAGEAAKAGPDGVAKGPGGAEGERAFASAAAALTAGDDPQAKANQNLVHQIGEYRTRLEAVTSQKSDLEAKLKKSEEAYAAAHDGKAAPKSEYEPTQEDWKELAKDGTIKYRIPCIRKPGQAFEPSREQLHALGLAPHDAEPIKNAYAQVGQDVWSVVKPLCGQALGSVEAAEKVGPATCIHVILDVESAKDPAATSAARKLVGEIRAGQTPMPGPNDPVHPVTRLFLATTGAAKTFESKLAESFGPEEARRIVNSDELCEGRHIFGGSASKR
jgi:ferric-dicitrate binding protein FerR (iron transport regulator)